MVSFLHLDYSQHAKDTVFAFLAWTHSAENMILEIDLVKQRKRLYLTL